MEIEQLVLKELMEIEMVLKELMEIEMEIEGLDLKDLNVNVSYFQPVFLQ